MKVLLTRHFEGYAIGVSELVVSYGQSGIAVVCYLDCNGVFRGDGFRDNLDGLQEQVHGLLGLMITQQTVKSNN